MEIEEGDDWCIYCGNPDISDSLDEEGSDDSGTEE